MAAPRRISESQKYEMYLMTKNGATQGEIAKIYGINQATVAGFVSDMIRIVTSTDLGLFSPFRFDEYYRLSECFDDATHEKAIQLIDRNVFPGYKIYFSDDYTCFIKIKN